MKALMCILVLVYNKLNLALSSVICHLSPDAVMYLAYPSKSALPLLSKAKLVWELGQLWKVRQYQLLIKRYYILLLKKVGT